MKRSSNGGQHFMIFSYLLHLWLIFLLPNLSQQRGMSNSNYELIRCKQYSHFFFNTAGNPMSRFSLPIPQGLNLTTVLNTHGQLDMGIGDVLFPCVQINLYVLYFVLPSVSSIGTLLAFADLQGLETTMAGGTAARTEQ